jgi:ATP phosphoribosyltransferase regulatory subunit
VSEQLTARHSKPDSTRPQKEESTLKSPGVNQFEERERQAARIMATFAEANYERVAPPMIQPADVFLDVVGESLRARSYVFSDPDGEEMCLRPDLTVPTCQLYLERHPAADVPARFCYLGTAFRYQPGGGSAAHTREIPQAGVESFAAADPVAADAEILFVTLRAIRAAGINGVQLRLGDLGLFHALLAALEIPDRWSARLSHLFWRPEAFRAELRRLTVAPASAVEGLPPDLVAKLDPADPARAEDLVAAHLEKHGIEAVGERTVGEIAESLLSVPLPPRIADIIARYLTVAGPVREAGGRIAELAHSVGIDLSEAIDAFDRRLALISVGGVAIDEAEFSAEFGRRFEYYSGFVFEVLSPQLGAGSPLAGGGRYDGMFRSLGAGRDVPAVGAAIYTERVLLASREQRR